MRRCRYLFSFLSAWLLDVAGERAIKTQTFYYFIFLTSKKIYFYLVLYGGYSTYVLRAIQLYVS